MNELSIRTEIPAAKLRSLEHYCQEKQAASMQRLGSILADKIEGYDTIITSEVFKTKLDESLREWSVGYYDPKDVLSCLELLFFVNVVLDDILPTSFLNQLKGLYHIPIS